MQVALLSVAWLIASVLFILSLRGLSHPETARGGNLYGALGMLLAVAATVLGVRDLAWTAVGGAVLVGVVVGGTMAARVAMTAMPEMVALLHSFVGLAAVLVGLASFLDHESNIGALLMAEVFVDVFIGAITFTGSIVAFLKLKGSVAGRPLLVPGRHAINAIMVLACGGLYFAALGGGDGGFYSLLGMTAIASVLGVHLVMAIGGADMPVVVSLLNSYSGWTASAAGFMLGNDLLIVTGALVGSSGAILSYIMCKAMNRSIWNVVFGGFGAEVVKKVADPGGERLEVVETSVPQVAAWLRDARNVVITPGYGMAVARAANAVKEVTRMLLDDGKKVRFAIHPVAGRLPGHMNVLLAEANVPYDIVLEMDEINDEFEAVDVVLVIGANDIVNPGAETDATSPIYGMPVLKVWRSKRVVMLKRSRAAGYAGVDNPLFYLENTAMLLGDARGSMEKLCVALREPAAAA